MINYYLLEITFEGIAIGFIIGITMISLMMMIYFQLNPKTEETIEEDNHKRILENYRGIAYNCLIDDDWTMTYVSSNAYKILGYTSEELINNSLISYNEVIHPKYRDFVKDKYNEAISNHQDIQIEYMIITKDNQERWVREDGHIIYDHFENPVSIDGYIYNIDFFKNLLQDNNRIKARYQSLFEDLDFPIIVIKENQVIEVNASAVSLFRADSKAQLIGLNPIDLIDESYHRFYKSRIERLRETKTANLTTDYKLKRMDGTDVIASVDGIPFFENGEMYINVILLEKDDQLSFNQRLKRTERRNRDLILYMHEGVGVFQLIPDTLDAQLVYANHNFSKFIYDEFSNLIYKRFSELFDGLIVDEFEKIFNQDKDIPLRKEVFNKHTKKYLQLIFYFNKENELIVQITDVTREKQLIQQYQEEKHTLDEILEATDTMIWTWDRVNQKLIYEGKTFEKLGYLPSNSDITNPEKIMSYFHPDDRDNLTDQLSAYFSHRIPYFSVEIRIKDVKGEYRWWMVRGRAVRYKDNVATVISGTFQDITHHKLKDEEIRFLSLHDQLTKLYNLRAYHEKMTSLDKRENWPISLAIIDVNGLKVFNDALSHSAGDDLLVKTSEILSGFAEEEDVLARIGGDEFVMIMPKTTLIDAEERFKKIDEVLSKETVSNIPISISYGVEEKFNGRFSLHQIKDMADSKMYQQKFSGKDTRLEILKSIRNDFFKENELEEKVVNYVHHLSLRLAKQIRLDQETTTVIDIASQYYNIGIFSIRKEVFNDERKFKRYDEVEYRKHVENGYRIMLATYRNERIGIAILHHHEKFDGSGYPGKLEGHKIPLASRIISIAATYARRTLLGEKAEDVLKYIVSEKNISFDPELVDEFMNILE